MTAEPIVSPADPTAALRRLSVVIPNFNYGAYVCQAVDSALAVDWPDVEVIVVDDASTDDSWDRLAAYQERVDLVRLDQNSGPRVACNIGFARSTGDVVIFLDSDDRLDPTIGRELAACWRPGLSKIQVQLERIDRAGRSMGQRFPTYRRTPTAAQIRRWMDRTAAYPTPPGSGNAYARSFLDQLFPLDDRCGDATDSACLAAAPYLGDVLTIARPLVYYRIHGANRSSIAADPTRLQRQIDRAWSRHQFAWEISGRSRDDVREVVRPLRRGRHLLQMRVAERRVCSGPPPLPTDGRGRMLIDSIVSIGAPGPESIPHRLAVSAWCLATMVAPRRIAHRLIRRRFA